MSPTWNAWTISVTIVAAVCIIANLTLAYKRTRDAGTNWRFWLPRLNVPMIGFGASYGVYAFNVPFLPWWAAITQAGSLESTYVGLAAMDDNNPETAATKKLIARWAGWLSFGENAIAGLFHARPDVLVWMARPDWIQLVCWSVLTCIHASQIWIAYHSAMLVFHTKPAATTDKPVKGLVARPASMRRSVIAAKMTAYPAPKRVNMTTPDILGDDPRAVEVRRLRAVLTNGRPMSYQKIADTLGLESRQAAHALDKHGRTYTR